MSIAAINNKYIPMQKSANAKLHIKNFVTVILNLDDIRTTMTDKLPRTAKTTTIHTQIRSMTFPITSSQGLNSSGSGEQTTSNVTLVNSPQIN